MVKVLYIGKYTGEVSVLSLGEVKEWLERRFVLGLDYIEELEGEKGEVETEIGVFKMVDRISLRELERLTWEEVSQVI